MNLDIFRAYDIRGVADRDLPDAVVTRIGTAYATLLLRAGARRIAVARDCRLSSERIFTAFTAALTAQGLDVLDVGIGPTPRLYWSVFHLDADGGVQITGSHNPGDQNGLKMMRGKASLHGDAILELARLAEAPAPAPAPHPGTVTAIDLADAYVADIAQRLTLGPRRLKIAIDGGNGAGGPSALDLLTRLGLDVVPLFIPMDGRFPNHHPDPTVEANLADLRAAVLEHGCDLGVAYDGDADRIGVIDDRGHILWGDRLLTLLARDLLRDHPGATIIGEVKCSETLFRDIAARGGRPIMSAVGHSIIKDRLAKENGLLAGEMSGHIFYRERWFGFDDAIYVTGRLVELLSKTQAPLSTLLSDLPTTAVTPEIRLACADAIKFDVVAHAAATFGASYPVITIDGARIDFGDGWGLIRASNTQPVIVLRAEAASPEALARIQATLEAFVAEHQPQASTPSG